MQHHVKSHHDQAKIVDAGTIAILRAAFVGFRAYHPPNIALVTHPKKVDVRVAP